MKKKIILVIIFIIIVAIIVLTILLTNKKESSSLLINEKYTFRVTKSEVMPSYGGYASISEPRFVDLDKNKIKEYYVYDVIVDKGKSYSKLTQEFSISDAEKETLKSFLQELENNPKKYEKNDNKMVAVTSPTYYVLEYKEKRYYIYNQQNDARQTLENIVFKN